MDQIRFEWIGIAFFFIVMISIQLSLNKIIVLLQEVIKLLKNSRRS
ncbi:MAG: hypothetical protein LCH34_03890 [Firmicutes bacterium]|nr:hypothetical protein [Bacillota bacterium]